MFIFVLVCFMGHLQVNAQKLKFGDVPISDLKMEVYEKDSSANAVVLFDVAEARIDENIEVRLKRHVRIKILTDEGLGHGDVELDFRHKSPKQKISKLKVHSYYLDNDGKVIKNKLGKKEKFITKTNDNWSELKFAIPNLKKGAIFEYEYEWHSESIHDLPDWYFQRSIPVKWSEYTAFVPEWFTYMVVKRSYVDFLVDEMKSYNKTAVITFKESMGGVGTGFSRVNTGARNRTRTESFDYVGTQYHWVIKDLPAIKDEPYMKAKRDYYAQVRTQLSRIQFPNSKAQTVLSTWPELIEALEEHSKFGKRIDGNKFLQAKANELAVDFGTEQEKMIVLYNHVKNTINWNEKHRLLADRKLQEVYKSGNGSGVEINLVLIQMLKEIGLKASPVIISTRNNGELIDLYPLTTQFNHVLAYVEADGVEYILDATHKDRPYSILPTSVMNVQGLLVSGENSKWVPIENTIKNRVSQSLEIKIDDEGSLSGELGAFLTGHFAYEARSESESNNSSDSEGDDEISSKIRDGIIIDSVEVSETDIMSPFKFKLFFSSTEYLDSSQDVIYFNPNLFQEEFETPFKLKDRQYPVDYEYPFTRSTTIKVQIPDSWEVSEYPKSRIHRLEGNKGEFRRLVQVQGNMITILYSLRINETRIMPEEYQNLKSMYDLMENCSGENFVFTQKSL